jgi:hypothetical protein
MVPSFLTFENRYIIYQSTFIIFFFDFYIKYNIFIIISNNIITGIEFKNKFKLLTIIIFFKSKINK